MNFISSFIILLFILFACLIVRFLTLYFYKRKTLVILEELLSIKPSLDLDRTLPQILTVIKKLFKPERCSIMLVDDTDNMLKIKIGDNISTTAMRKIKLNIDEGIAGKSLTFRPHYF